ncbi:MAG TPA: SRPBCC family protein [Acidimicrobiia bacterium]|jgi:carbon monoxide dehydrogenase subunit G|nr:SRPBCC family protein [Acidimicrobiia bacterium]
MASGKAEISIDRSADEVWKLLREFGGLAEWMPGVDTCTVEGDVRTLGMMGMEVKERLEKLDDDNRVIAYSLFDAPIPNLESHLCTISVDPEGSGSHVTWSVEVSPDGLLGVFLPIYEGSIGEIKKKVEG